MAQIDWDNSIPVVSETPPESNAAGQVAPQNVQRPPQNAQIPTAVESVAAPKQNAVPTRSPFGTARWPQSGAENRPTISSEGKVTLPNINTALDVAKSAISQGTLGVSANIPGIVGDVGSMYDWVASRPSYAALMVAERMGKLPPGETASSLFKKMDDSGKSEAEQKGYVNKIFGLPVPTTAGLEELQKKYVAPGLGYQPKTREGEVAGSVTRFATSMLGPGGWKNAAEKGYDALLPIGKEALKRMGLGAVMGVTAEGGSELAKNTAGKEYDPYFRFIGAMTPLAAKRAITPAQGLFESFYDPKAQAEQRVAAALAKDTQRGNVNMSQEDINKAKAYGETPTLQDIGGPTVNEMTGEYAYQTPSSTQAFRKVKEYFADRASKLDLPDWMTTRFNLPANAGEQALALEKTRQITNNKLYGAARNNPAAQSLWSPELERLSGKKPIQSAIDQVNEYADGVLKKDANGQPIPGSEIVGYTPSGAAFKGSEPNLNFWHEVKLRLDDQITTASRAGNINEANSLRGLKDQLLKEMESSVPEYGVARDTASGLFNAENAYEAGFNALTTKNMIKSAKSIDGALKQYDPENLIQFQTGTASYLKQVAESANGTTKLLTILNNPTSKPGLIRILGGQGYRQLLDSANAELQLSKTSLKEGVSPSGNIKTFGPTAAVAALAGPILNVAYWTNPNLMTAVVAGLSSGAAAGFKYVLTKGEQNVAPEIIKLLGSRDPDAIKRVTDLAKSSPTASNLITKLNWAATRLPSYNAKANPLPDNDNSTPADEAASAPSYATPRTGRASGGRIMNHKSEAENLIRLADKTKKALNNSTESLLAVPDEAVTKALSIANEAI